MVYIYVLKLEKGKFYVGKTDNPNFRLEQHLNSKGSYWTKKYKPINIEEIIPNCDDYDEDKITQKYMDLKGIDNVRGGSFTKIKLDEDTIKFLTKKKNSTLNKCFVCHKTGHFASNCPKKGYSKKKTIAEVPRYQCAICNKLFTEAQFEKHVCNINLNTNISIDYDIYSDDEDDDVCYRCGRKGHHSSSCYARKHINGYYLRK